jgi:hypothetical protein
MRKGHRTFHTTDHVKLTTVFDSWWDLNLLVYETIPKLKARILIFQHAKVYGCLDSQV